MISGCPFSSDAGQVPSCYILQRPHVSFSYISGFDFSLWFSYMDVSFSFLELAMEHIFKIILHPAFPCVFNGRKGSIYWYVINTLLSLTTPLFKKIQKQRKWNLRLCTLA